MTYLPCYPKYHMGAVFLVSAMLMHAGDVETGLFNSFAIRSTTMVGWYSQLQNLTNVAGLLCLLKSSMQSSHCFYPSSNRSVNIERALHSRREAAAAREEDPRGLN
jgi:hypothetical protein